MQVQYGLQGHPWMLADLDDVMLGQRGQGPMHADQFSASMLLLKTSRSRGADVRLSSP